MQKVKHLEYEHGNNQDRVKADAEYSMKEERTHHIDDEKDMRKDKKNQKEEYGRDELQNIEEVGDREKELE